ncbi:hypothetical protein CMK12_06835 [Candidatus Poribacteria bacterium]|nr:hypothetical protein [Candidatus Poribacteria bacterium]MDP6745940.1 hypothetical protein [Candidatus Poribacteria bacterium]MDP6995313.1 hypothetical protein [Candidatus Poribacteria bacterium]
MTLQISHVKIGQAADGDIHQYYLTSSKFKDIRMKKSVFILALTCFLAVSLFAGLADAAPKKIEGPWLWMIAPTEAGKGGADSTDIDTLKKASGGSQTQEGVAKNGVKAGAKCGNLYWTWGKLAPTGGNNVNDLVTKIGLGKGDVNDHDSWAYVEFEAKAQKGVELQAGSDDSIKIWLNGEVVHKNAVNRGAGDFQDKAKVNVIDGVNRLLVKVGEKGGGWSMFVGIDTTYTVVAVEPAHKLATTWAKVRNR